jgi:predicted MFS family arabinose efflux permease
MSGLDVFAQFARKPEVRGPIVWSVLGRIPMFLQTLALVLHVTRQSESYAVAGSLLACYTMGGIVLGPVVSRGIDRYGQTPFLVGTAFVHPLALAAFVLAGSGPLLPRAALLLVAGGAIPPVTASIRVLWSALPLSSDRATAYSLEAVLGEVFVISGPLLLSVLLLAGAPGTAIVIGGLLSGIGGLGFAATKVSRQWKPTPRKKQTLLGPLRSAALVNLLGISLACAAAVGVFNVALPAFAQANGSADDVGLMYAAWGVGGTIGGIWFAGRKFGLPLETLFSRVTAVFAVLMVLPALVWDEWSMGVALAVTGTALSPYFAVSYELIGRAAPKDSVAEAFTWVMIANTAGGAVGAEAGGFIISWSGTRAAFAAAVVLAFCAAAGAVLARRRPAAKPSSEMSEGGPDATSAHLVDAVPLSGESDA